MNSASSRAQPLRGLAFAMPPSVAWWAGLVLDWRAGWLVLTLWAVVIGPVLAAGLLVAEVRLVGEREWDGPMLSGPSPVGAPSRSGPNRNI